MKMLSGTGVFVLAFLAISCSNTVEGLKKDAEENKVQEKTEKAAEAVATAVKEAGREIKATTLALDVKTSLMADKRVDASHVHVEADDAARTLTLSGYVPTLAQIQVAGVVARSKAGDYRVLNRLTAVRS
jgi:osmotically-inducible protein OsmY